VRATSFETMPYEWITRLWMAQAQDKSACYLLVEGPDDVAALQKFAHDSCAVTAAGGKTKIEEALAHAVKVAASRQKQLHGLLGAIDRDFDGIKGTPASVHPRLARIDFPNDLESAVAHHRGHDLYESVFIKERVRGSDWLGYSGKEHDSPFDRLVRRFASPLGAIRAAWRASGLAYEPLTESDALISELWRDAYARGSVEPQHFDRMLPANLSQPQRTQLLQQANELHRAANAAEDPWRLVRGKDLLSFCAFAAFRERVAIRPDLPLSQLRFELSRAAVHLFDFEVLVACGLEAAIARASHADTDRHRYLRSA
jgi:hypothetical protein